MSTHELPQQALSRQSSSQPQIALGGRVCPPSSPIPPLGTGRQSFQQQYLSAPQREPQPPQFSASKRKSSVGTHLPSQQLSLLLHLLPQEPQFSLVVRSKPLVGLPS